MNNVQIERARATDTDAVERLLESATLPTLGVSQWLDSAVVARDGDRIVGCAALEIYPSGVLLRSVAVDDAWRGRGLGKDLVESALTFARQRGATAAFLLTTTAPQFFPRFGFVRITRAEVPDDVKQSIEFTSVCCSSAIVMRADLGGA